MSRKKDLKITSRSIYGKQDWLESFQALLSLIVLQRRASGANVRFYPLGCRLERK